MATQFPDYTLAELEQRARDLIRTRRRGADVSWGSDWDLTARMLAALAFGLQKQGEVALRLLDPRKAFGAYLRQYAYEAGSGRDITLTSAAAAKAKGRVILISTTGSQTQAAGSVLRHQDGTEYTLDSAVTTPASATKTLYVGHRSGRRRLYQGHTGGGFASPAVGEVYRFAPTSEFCAVRDVDNASALKRYMVDMYNDLSADPDTHQQFNQQLGVVANVTATFAGYSGNKDPKDYLYLVSPSGTVQAQAHVLYLRGGSDEMTPSEMQTALTELLGVRKPAGTVEDIIATAKGYPGITVSECYLTPATRGIGTYTLMPVTTSGQYIGANELADIRQYVADRQSPADRFYTASVYEVADTAVDRITVQCAAAYEPDWKLQTDSVIGYTITTTGVSSLTLSSVTGMELGDRIIVTCRGAVPYLTQRRVASIVGLVVGLDRPLPFPPDTASSYVTPGGPIGDQVIESLYAAYEARAPSLGATGTQVRFPRVSVADDPSSITAAVNRIEGVLDAAYWSGVAPSLPNVGGVLVPRCVVRMYGGG